MRGAEVEEEFSAFDTIRSQDTEWRDASLEDFNKAPFPDPQHPADFL
jgi:hypothetical protein